LTGPRSSTAFPHTSNTRPSGFKGILEGKHDSVAEGDFYMKGGIDEVKPS
jgi:hypothetical protein